MVLLYLKDLKKFWKQFKNKKIKQAIVSSKLREQYEIDIVSKGIDQYMEAVILQDDTTFHKPHPEPLLKCIEKLNLKPEEVIYIGDAQSDYEASKTHTLILVLQNGVVLLRKKYQPLWFSNNQRTYCDY